MSDLYKSFSFCGIKFININTLNISGTINIIKKNGLFVFPSGPGLANLKINSKYHLALKNSEYVFLDSGFFVLLLNLFKKVNCQKFSGYKFLKILFYQIKKKKINNIFLVDPSIKLSLSYRKYIKKKLKINCNYYIAPKYKKVEDKILLKKISILKPKIILINIGGGVQEILGHYLKKNLNYKPTIICTGAAIAYFTKDQASINNFIDRIYLGWLVRIFYKPKIFLPRYLSAFKLFFLVLNNNVITKN